MTTRSARMLGAALCFTSAATVIASLLFLGLGWTFWAGLAAVGAFGVAYAIAEVRAMPW